MLYETMLLRDQGLSSGVLLCGKDGKRDLENLLQLNQVVTLLSRGDVKYDILNYLNTHPNIQIKVKLKGK